jgi:hypothetical protein
LGVQKTVGRKQKAGRQLGGTVGQILCHCLGSVPAAGVARSALSGL